MSIVAGIDVDLYIFNSGVWKLIACGRSLSKNDSAEFIETSTSGNGIWATFAPSKMSFTLQAEGLVHLQEMGMLTLPDLKALMYSQTPLLIRKQTTDIEFNVFSEQFTAYISNISDVSSFDNVMTFSLSFRGTGGTTLDYAAITPVPIGGILVNRYEWQATGGEYGFTDSVLINKYLLEVNVDGHGDGRILFSGTPVGDEVVYNKVTGEFTWAIPFEAGEEVYIIYQDL